VPLASLREFVTARRRGAAGFAPRICHRAAPAAPLASLREFREAKPGEPQASRGDKFAGFVSGFSGELVSSREPAVISVTSPGAHTLANQRAGASADEKTDDAALVARVRGGASPEAAFAALFERHADEVFSFLVRFLRDRALAEDALQESFYRVYRALDQFDTERPFRPWLHEVARNVALDALRARDKFKTAEPSGETDRTVREREPLDEVARREGVAEVSDALLLLAPETRALLLQRHDLGLKLDELASSLGVTERTVRNRLKAAAAELAHFLIARRAKADRR
jgi:RNA polymerase sigma-70 factor (ECF subfamily)